MQIYINRNGQQFGPFEEVKVEEMLRNRQFLPTDFGIRQGEQEWQSLDNLFPQTVQTPAQTTSVASSNPQDFYNQPVVNWAKQMLAKSFEVKLKFNSIFSKMLGILLVSLFPLGIFIYWIFGVIQWSQGRTQYKEWYVPLVWAIWMIIFSIPSAVIWLVIRYSRSKFVKNMNDEGIETVYGKKYLWKDLYQVNYTRSQDASRANSNLVANLILAGIFAGVKKIEIELVFAKGKVKIPRAVNNQAEILSLMDTIPAQVSGKSQIPI